MREGAIDQETVLTSWTRAPASENIVYSAVVDVAGFVIMTRELLLYAAGTRPPREQ